jgi:protein required for attachment to host cells
MNEVAMRKHMKNVIKKGISKHIAKDIVHTALTISDGSNPEMAIAYAIDLVYGLGQSQRVTNH